MSELISGPPSAPSSNGSGKHGTAKNGSSVGVPSGSGSSVNRLDVFAHDESTARSAAAAWAVAEYLRDVGLRDPELIARESQRMVLRAERELLFQGNGSDGSLAEAAIHLTVKELDQWLTVLASDTSDAGEPQRLGGVVGARLPALLGRYPEAWKQRRPSPELVESLKDDVVPVVPAPRPRTMRRQTLELVPTFWRRLRRAVRCLRGKEPGPADPEPAANAPHVASSRSVATRMLLGLLTIVGTAAGVWQYRRALAGDGLGLADLALSALFVSLFVWVVFAFWMATFGLVSILRRLRNAPSPVEEPSSGPLDLPPTAVVMPIHNEEPKKVFANVRAVAKSLHEAGGDAPFSIFVLSDTTDPDVWLEEERAWAKLVAQAPLSCRVFYRRRPKNLHRKAGNIADFCSRWGGGYKYMIVLDADSVMEGATLVEMVRRMERDPKIGILQAPPRPVNRGSFFARMQQFAAYMYNPVFLEGFVLWSECDGNYWGHNAILRVRPFMEHCELPILPGDGPLGGEILSHDFVEAALIRRAGWKVCIAHDLEGSYEECPTTILDSAQRDQRWCQGNMQHIRLLAAEGFHPASRLHFGMGAMSYLASPLWLAFLVLTVVIGALQSDQSTTAWGHAPGGAALFIVTMALLLLPKVWGAIAMSRHPDAPPKGLSARTWASVLIETLMSMLIAPIMMLLHSQFVVTTFLGTKVKWNAQQRDDREVAFSDAFSMHWPHTLFGLALGGFTYLLAPGLLPWLSPVLAGLLFSIPLAMILGSGRIGAWLGRQGLLRIPEEETLPTVLRYQRDALAAGSKGAPARADVFDLVLRDPTFYALHVGILRATEGGAPLSAEQQQQFDQLLRDGGDFSTAPKELRRAVLGDWRTLEKLHVRVRSQVAPTQSALTA